MRVSVADDLRDGLVDAIANTIRAESGNDRGAALYTLYFKNQRPSDLKRPILGGQLEAMRGWLPSLKDAPSAALRALGDQLESAVEQADAAEKALSTARQRNRDFRTVGEHKAFIDATNAIRKSTYGAPDSPTSPRRRTFRTPSRSRSSSARLAARQRRTCPGPPRSSRRTSPQ